MLLDPLTTVIEAGASLSAEVNLDDAEIFAIILPAVWTTANLTFQVYDPTSQTFVDLYDDSGVEVEATVGALSAGRCVAIKENALPLSPHRRIKIRSGKTGAGAVNQAASRVLTIIRK